MQTHPDADAFMRAYLAQPTDATSRLVFADWLEETGEAHNAAWAHYIRLQIEADRHPADSREWRELTRQADEYASLIRAKLVISAKVFVGYPKSLLQLLPGANITVRLADMAIPLAVLELLPQGVAHHNHLIPFAVQPGVIFVAFAEAPDEEIRKTASFVMGRQVIAVRAEKADIRAAIDRYFPWNPETRPAQVRRHWLRRLTTG